MEDSEVVVLFECMAMILSNQEKIMRHLGISKYDSEWGWDDDNIEKQIHECYSIARDYKDD